MIISYKILGIISTLLFLATLPMPYNYYTFLRIIVCGCAGYICYELIKGKDKSLWPWAWGSIAIVFNPFVAIHMSKGSWTILDASVGFIFLYAAWQTYNQNKK